ncbi:hypothetical protein L596_022962 [Steinernema carpocapsae]|uniref:Uncharacterized protein n=1 Tax=Steinernema carpocapsae TaxID=34508 RepID=A0A4U5MCE8_STECR|nr:hypothetical protein L596_022962 [Steinernema carpocapsae]
MLKAWPILSLLVLALVIFTAAARALDDDSSEEEFQPGPTQPPNEEDEEQQGPVGPTQPPKQRGYHFKHHHAKWRKYDTPVIDSLSSSEVVVLPREKTLWEAVFEGWLKTTTRRLPTDDETANMDEKLGRSLMKSKPRARPVEISKTKMAMMRRRDNYFYTQKAPIQP